MTRLLPLLFILLSACQSQSVFVHPAQTGENEYKIVKVYPPVFPEDLRRQNIEGWVIVEFSLNEQGLVDKAEVIDELPTDVFSEEALKSVRKTVYRAATKNGQPIRTDGIQTKVSFKLTYDLPAHKRTCADEVSEFDNPECARVK